MCLTSSKPGSISGLTWAQASGAAYQLVQSQIAVAAGGLVGTGPGLGSPFFIPVAISDFIFPAVAEETGLLGGSALILLLMILVMRGISVAQTTKTTFGRYLAFGISAYLGAANILHYRRQPGRPAAYWHNTAILLLRRIVSRHKPTRRYAAAQDQLGSGSRTTARSHPPTVSLGVGCVPGSVRVANRRHQLAGNLPKGGAAGKT